MIPVPFLLSMVGLFSSKVLLLCPALVGDDCSIANIAAFQEKMHLAIIDNVAVNNMDEDPPSLVVCSLEDAKFDFGLMPKSATVLLDSNKNGLS